MALLPDNFDLNVLTAASLVSRIIPTEAPTDIPSFKIFAGDQEIAGYIGVISISVSRMINKISSARIILADGDSSKEDFKLSSGDTFIPGTSIRIEMGYHQINRIVFRGIIVKHALKARGNQPSVLILDVKHEAVKMTSIRKNAVHTAASDDDVITKIIQSYDPTQKGVLSSASGAFGSQNLEKEIVQYNATDWDFILARADAMGKYVFTPDGEIRVEKPSFDALPILMANLGSSIIEVEAEMDATYQYETVKSSSWDTSKLKMEHVDAKLEDKGNLIDRELGNIDTNQLSKVLDNKEYRLFHAGNVSTDELKGWADAKLQRSKLSRIRGRVRITGFGSVMPGDMIQLNGLGDRFNGAAFVTGVNHEMTNDGWTTDIQFGLSHEGFTKSEEGVSAQPTSGVIPAISGIVTGIVTQLDQDPENQNRVKVKIPVINEESDGVWARISGLDFGNNKGVFFLPDVGDEVIVGFLNDDPRYPIVLGALYSSTNVPPIPFTKDNFQKGIVTKAGVKISIDDEKKIVTIETPGANKITISDEDKKISILDQNQNKLEMTEDGIVLESAKDLSIKAKGDINVEGVNVSIKASSEFKAEGSGGVEVSSTATAVLKGALVQIN